MSSEHFFAVKKVFMPLYDHNANCANAQLLKKILIINARNSKKKLKKFEDFPVGKPVQWLPTNTTARSSLCTLKTSRGKESFMLVSKIIILVIHN